RNNLKQIGLALHNYHDSYGMFPPALINSGRSADRSSPGYLAMNTTAWVMLLSYLDQAPLFEQYNFNVCSSMDCDTISWLGSCPGVAGDDTINAAVYQQRLSVLECPSDPHAGERSTYREGQARFYSRRNVPRSSYLLATGNKTDYDRNYNWGRSRSWWAYGMGMFGNNGAARIRGVTDGTSTTIAAGESWGGRYKCSRHYGPWGLAGVHTGIHGRVYGDTRNPNDPRWQGSWRNWGINRQWPASWCLNPAQSDNVTKVYAWVFTSGHAGGAHFVLGDGSVRFINDSIDYFTFVLLNYIADNRPVQF
ncbi:MAG TPA: DUF1559 domain-containing protein, partial [Planctomycetaceae bacterium]|nr:DUF1559 domain-containing protein [Planctomycetaceae bacterium]